MKQLTINELKNIRAGAASGWVGVAVGTIVTFIIGIIDGYVRPFKCR